ncbi:hypothetical protein QYM36_013116 [Artemia franciscana]|uniref:Uncharacterized protein n=1 Tax=Artemia franciscana TaxID=6661 RepID=A0AA88L630_ARTSF|nr:hypothetical protein QYM36_013116 [Artemia franciscana]
MYTGDNLLEIYLYGPIAMACFKELFLIQYAVNRLSDKVRFRERNASQAYSNLCLLLREMIESCTNESNTIVVKFRKLFLQAVLRNKINPKCKSREIRLLGEYFKTLSYVNETMGARGRLRILPSRA